MKIVVFSDSHGDGETMCIAVEKEEPDLIIYLGDGIEDIEVLKQKYPGTKMISVLGGVDSDREDEEWIKVVEMCGKRFIITHGHTFIKYTFVTETEQYEQTDEDRTRNRIEMLKILQDYDGDVLLHGHTHEPYIDSVLLSERKCWIMNPGRIGRLDSAIDKATYGILEFDDSGVFKCHLEELELE